MNKNPKNRVKPNLIMLVGLPGSGKTFFGKQFSDEYRIPFININRIRHQIIENPTYDNYENNKINQISVELLLEQFKLGSSVVIETDLYSKKNRQTYAKLAKKYGYDSFMIWTKIDPEEAKYRATNKIKRNSKDFLITEENFDKIAKKFTEPDKKDKIIVISGKHAFKNQYKMVLKKIIDNSKINNRIP